MLFYYYYLNEISTLSPHAVAKFTTINTLYMETLQILKGVFFAPSLSDNCIYSFIYSI